jgi:PIN domain nuclease of toxin-antitoxin system
MRLLLDTHAFLWFLMGDPRISSSARSLIEDETHEKVLSVASLWEIAIKVGLGKLTLAEPFEVLIPREIDQAGFITLPITLPHAAIVSKLPHHHRDPFDRLLIAQAMAEGMSILSADSALDAYAITRLW